MFSSGRADRFIKERNYHVYPKGKNKDKLLLKNWRPISLLNTSYKLASSCIAERLKAVLPFIINADQTEFILGRYIGENIRILYGILYFPKKKKKKKKNVAFGKFRDSFWFSVMGFFV